MKKFQSGVWPPAVRSRPRVRLEKRKRGRLAGLLLYCQFGSRLARLRHRPAPPTHLQARGGPRPFCYRRASADTGAPAIATPNGIHRCRPSNAIWAQQRARGEPSSPTFKVGNQPDQGVLGYRRPNAKLRQHLFDRSLHLTRQTGSNWRKRSGAGAPTEYQHLGFWVKRPRRCGSKGQPPRLLGIPKRSGLTTLSFRQKGRKKPAGANCTTRTCWFRENFVPSGTFVARVKIGK